MNKYKSRETSTTVGVFFLPVYAIIFLGNNHFQDNNAGGKIKDMEGWAGCFDGVELKGVVKALRTDETGDVLKFADVLAQAYAYGKNLL